MKKIILNIAADTGITSVVGHTLQSNGGAPSTPLRQNQNWSGFDKKVALLDFDVAPLQGWVIEKAYLHLAVGRGDLCGVGLCTVLAPWGAGAGQGFQQVTEAACWDYRSTPASGQASQEKDYWAGPGSSLATVAWANPAAHYCHVGPNQISVKRWDDGRTNLLRLPVDPVLVEALASGISWGWALTDDKGQVAEALALKGDALPYRYDESEDIWIYTSKAQHQDLRPRLEVWGQRGSRKKPGKIVGLQVGTMEAAATNASLRFAAPRQAFAYEVAVYNKPVNAENWERARLLPRWSINKSVAAGEQQHLALVGLEPGVQHVGVRALSVVGKRGDIASVRVEVPAVERVRLKVRRPKSSGQSAAPSVFGQALQVNAVPDLVKVDPVSGLLLRDGDHLHCDPDYLGYNSVWDADKGTVNLRAAANEVVAFQLILALPGRRQKASDVRVVVDDLSRRGGGHIAADPQVQLFRVWYVETDGKLGAVVGPNQDLIEDRKIRPSGWHGEVCLPLGGGHPETVQLPASDNAVPGQKCQAVWVDLYVPGAALAGTYRGKIHIHAGELSEPIALDLKLEVLPIALPDEVHWTMELNRYNSPLQWLDIDLEQDPERGKRLLHDCYRLAQAHRQTLTALPYRHSGKVDSAPEYVPELAGEGTGVGIADWSRFDEYMGPLLDGSAFSTEQGYVGPRCGQPVTHFFLPFHEAWPVPVDAQTYKDWADLNERGEFAQWAKTSRRPADGFSAAYKRAYRKVVRQFFRHVDKKGYDATQFVFFFNNKYYFKLRFFGDMGNQGASFWLLDEPIDFDDYDANRFLFELSRQGVRESGTKARTRFRADISQPEMMRGLWDGLVDMWMIGGRAEYATTGALRRAMLPQEGDYWSYGGGTSVAAPLVNNQRHALFLWALGDNGYMPWWNSFGGNAGAWQRGETLALFYRGCDYPGKEGTYDGPLASVRMKAVRRVQQNMEYLFLLAAAKGWSHARLRRALQDFADADDAGHLHFGGLTLGRSEQLFRAVADTVVDLQG
jgi:hypothetical protein